MCASARPCARCYATSSDPAEPKDAALCWVPSIPSTSFWADKDPRSFGVGKSARQVGRQWDGGTVVAQRYVEWTEWTVKVYFKDGRCTRGNACSCSLRSKSPEHKKNLQQFNRNRAELTDWEQTVESDWATSICIQYARLCPYLSSSLCTYTQG